MSKRNKLRKQAAAAEAAATSVIGLTLGSHRFRAFTGFDMVFGADLEDYPPYDAIPEQFRRGNTAANDAVSTLFFRGGKIDEFGLRLKSGVDPNAFYGALKAMLCSFAPKYEHKEAACAWLVSEYTEAA